MTSTLADLVAPVAEGLREVEALLREELASDATEVRDLAAATVLSGGKRLRPALVLLTARLGNSDVSKVLDVAAGIELIHAATLIHDDLIDDSPLRRGIDSIHSAAGLGAAVVVGDHYLAKGIGLVARGGGAELAERAAATVMAICAGEIRQMRSQLDLDRSVEDYLAAIGCKTAGLTELCCYAGAALAGLTPGDVVAAAAYGRELGVAFQIADDLLDYTADADAVGKPVGADLRQGVVTLPLMLALQDPRVTEELRAVLTAAKLGDEEYAGVARLVRNSHGVDGARAMAQESSTRALGQLSKFPDTPSRRALEDLCDYVIARRI